jgi:hypothetical protein
LKFSKLFLGFFVGLAKDWGEGGEEFDGPWVATFLLC